VPVVPVLEPEPELAAAGATFSVDVLVDGDVWGREPGGSVCVADPAAGALELSVEVVPGVVDVVVPLAVVLAVVEVSSPVVPPVADPVPDVPREVSPVCEGPTGALPPELGSVTESADAGMCGGVATRGCPAGRILAGGEDVSAGAAGADAACALAATDAELDAELTAGAVVGAGALTRWTFAAGLTW
jgi:hypothetical protein